MLAYHFNQRIQFLNEHDYSESKYEILSSLRTKKLFKITNSDENHHGYQYHNGLNVFDGNFNFDVSCGPC